MGCPVSAATMGPPDLPVRGPDAARPFARYGPADLGAPPLRPALSSADPVRDNEYRTSLTIISQPKERDL
jgi:hypothetical protein